MSADKKLILVIGATGGQGLAVIDALLKPTADGSPSPYAVRALTRDTKSPRAQLLASKGVQVVPGSSHDFPSVLSALEGVYGAYVNTDSFTIGEQKEVFEGLRIFELAKQAGTVKHYVWSSLDNVFQLSNYDPKYYAEHYTGKCRVADWMRSQESVVSDDAMSWSVLTTGPYMDMLSLPVFGPMRIRPDGTHVFAAPIGAGHVPMIALKDLGFFARYIFDHRAETSAQELKIASDWVGWDYLVETFKRVTGRKAAFVPLAFEDWVALGTGTSKPLASEGGPGSTTWAENMDRWWRLYREDVIQRDFESLRKINPGLMTVEQWMRANDYKGEMQPGLLKGTASGSGAFSSLVMERVEKL